MNTTSLPWFRRLDDVLNPIVVKELRQAVNSKFVSGILLVFLLTSLFTVAVLLLSSDLQNNYAAGKAVLMWLQGTLLAVCLLFLPTYTGARLAAERSDVNVDLMFITTIPAGAIVWGKLLASVILAVLIYSACMPFMALTYVMRGIDLPSILLVLVMGFAVVTVSIMLGMLTASISKSRGLRVLLFLGMLGVLVSLFSATLALSFNMIESGVGSRLGTGKFWMSATTTITSLGTALAILYAWTVALIRPVSSNRMLPVRITMTAGCVVMGVVTVGSDTFHARSLGTDIWLIVNAVLLGLSMLIAVCEREAWGPRVARTIPRHRVRRIIAFIFYSGAAGGLIWAWLLFGMAAAAHLVMEHSTHSAGTQLEIRISTLTAVAGCYACAITALLIRRYLLARFIPPDQTWCLALVIGVIFSLAPFDSVVRSTIAWFPLNPIEFASRGPAREIALTVFSVWSFVATLLAVPWILEQVRAFRPPAESESTRAIS